MPPSDRYERQLGLWWNRVNTRVFGGALLASPRILLDRALDAVGRHYTATGRGDLFARLRPALTAYADSPTQAAIARELGMTAGAVQVALHRLRARFREILRAEIAATLDDPSSAEIDAEVRNLFDVLSR